MPQLVYFALAPVNFTKVLGDFRSFAVSEIYFAENWQSIKEESLAVEERTRNSHKIGNRVPPIPPPAFSPVRSQHNSKPLLKFIFQFRTELITTFGTAPISFKIKFDLIPSCPTFAMTNFLNSSNSRFSRQNLLFLANKAGNIENQHTRKKLNWFYQEKHTFFCDSYIFWKIMMDYSTCYRTPLIIICFMKIQFFSKHTVHQFISVTPSKKIS